MTSSGDGGTQSGTGPKGRLMSTFSPTRSPSFSACSTSWTWPSRGTGSAREFIRPAAWPTTTMLAAFKAFLQPRCCSSKSSPSLRQGKLLAETIADFWSPHGPIHERARNALAQFGAGQSTPAGLAPLDPRLDEGAAGPTTLVLATIGPSTIPALLRHLHDPQEHVRARCGGLPRPAQRGGHRPGPRNPQPGPECPGPAERGRSLGSTRVGPDGVHPRDDARFSPPLAQGPSWRGGGGTGEGERRLPPCDPVDLAVKTLETALSDESAAVRTQAVESLGRIGSPASAVVPGLIALLKDPDESVRCETADALSRGRRPPGEDDRRAHRAAGRRRAWSQAGGSPCCLSVEQGRAPRSPRTGPAPPGARSRSAPRPPRPSHGWGRWTRRPPTPWRRAWKVLIRLCVLRPQRPWERLGMPPRKQPPHSSKRWRMRATRSGPRLWRRSGKIGETGRGGRRPQPGPCLERSRHPGQRPLAAEAAPARWANRTTEWSPP